MKLNMIYFPFGILLFVKCKHIIWECNGIVVIICIKWETTDTETLGINKYKRTWGYSHLPNALYYHAQD